MRTRSLLCAALLLGAAGLAWAGDLQKQGFGEARHGLAMRVRKGERPAGASPLLLPIQVELRAVESKPVLLSAPFPPKFLLESEAGLPLPEGVMQFPSRSPLERPDLEVKPGAPLKWIVRLLRTSDKAPKKLTLRGSLSHVGAVRYGATPLSSAALELDLSRLPLPKALEKKHLATGWTGASAFVYHLYEGLYGWRMLAVQPDGTATVFRSKVHGDAGARGSGSDLPAGTFSAPLTSAERKALAASLLAQEVWKLAELPKRMLIPDESSATLALVAGDAAVFARYPIAEAQKAGRDYAAFQQALEALMQRIVKRAQKGKR